MSNIMNKPELIEKMTSLTGKGELTKKQAEIALAYFQDVVTDALSEGKKVQLMGFGTFEITERQPRTGRNPQTGEEILIAGGKAPKFKPGKQFKDAIKNS